MAQKTYVLILYGLCLFGVIASPIFVFNSGRRSPHFKLIDIPAPKFRYLSLLTLLSGALVFTAWRYSHVSLTTHIFITSFGLCFLALKKTKFKVLIIYLIAIFISIFIASTLPWWRRESGGLGISVFEEISYLGICLVLSNFLLKEGRDLNQKNLHSLSWKAIFLLWTLFMSFSLKFSANNEILVTMWHHWGAYIAPAESIISGARLFYDVPAQYGLGPTLILVLGCKIDCWNQAYLFFAVMALLYSLILAAIALNISEKSVRPIWLVLLISIFASTAWIAEPSILSSPLSTPSTSGARFLPPALMAMWIIYVGSNLIKYRYLTLILWLFGLLWSPESAYCVTVIWCSLYLFNISVKFNGNIKEIFKGCVWLCFTFLLLAASLWMVYRLTYGINIDLSIFLVYMLNPPGAMPINFQGPVWFFIFSLVLSIVSSWLNWYRYRDVRVFSRSYLLQLLALSTFSYFLGRSHDNNILNLMPFMGLLLLDVVVNASFSPIKVSAAIAISSIVGWVSVFGLGYWVKAFKQEAPNEFNFSRQKAVMNYHDDANPFITLKQESLEKLREGDWLMHEIFSRGEQFEFLDRHLDLQPNYPNNSWAGMHGPANFYYVPSQTRRLMMTRTAASLGKSGWIIVDLSYAAGYKWVADFDAVYKRTEELKGPNYYAIRYEPKTEK